MSTANAEFSRRAMLRRCQVLVRRVRPNLPPEGSSPSEFAWQCRALTERVQTYEELLSDSPEVLMPGHLEYRVQRIEAALAASLEYFRRVYLDLQPADADEEAGRPRPERPASGDGQGLQ